MNQTLQDDKLFNKTGIIGDALAPNFNEAFANQMYLLSQWDSCHSRKWDGT